MLGTTGGRDTAVEIPQALRNPEYRFIKVGAKRKVPIEAGWQNTANYSFNDPGLLEHIKGGGNYGVLGGYGKLIIIDADCADVVRAIKEGLPQTFEVETGGGGRHSYYQSALEKPIRLIGEGEAVGKLGDVQAKGKFVVGAFCIHPNGKRYRIANNAPIAEIEEGAIRLALRKWIPAVRDKVISNGGAVNNETSISIAALVDTTKLKQQGAEWRGPHPIHDSTGGNNFSINTEKNIWHCFRCSAGGGPLSWIAVKEGLIKCHEATPGALRGALFKKVIKIGQEKYGLPVADDTAPCGDGHNAEGKFIPAQLGAQLCKELNIKTVRESEELFVYKDGCYISGESIIKVRIKELCGDKFKAHKAEEVVTWIKINTYSEIDNPPINLLCLKNGIYDIKTGELLPHSPKHFFLSKMNVKYDADVEAELSKKFYSQIVAKEDIIMLQELAGYCLYRDYPLHKTFMLVGSGRNGKSSFLFQLKTLLGDKNTSCVPLQSLCVDRFAKADLFGRMANICNDISSAALKYTGLLKQLCGGDPISGERKFGKRFDFVNFAKLIFSCNTLPKSDDKSIAFFARWVIINFPNIFLPGDVNTDPLLKPKLIEEKELSGVFNWMLEGLERILKQGYFTRAAGHEETRELYERMSDSLYAFVDDCIVSAIASVDKEGGVIKEGGFIEKELLYQKFLEYCKGKKLPTMSKREVTQGMPLKAGARLDRKQIDKKRTWGWFDIKFRGENEEKEKRGLDVYV